MAAGYSVDKPAEWRAIDVDLHRTLAAARHSPDLGRMDENVKALIQEALKRGFGVYVTCGGFASNGPEFKDKVRRWLDRNGLDSSEIQLVSKRKTVMVVDDHAIEYDGQDLVDEFKKRARKLDEEGSPDVR